METFVRFQSHPLCALVGKKGKLVMLKKSGKDTSKRVHIISRNDSWAIKKQGASIASKIYQKKETAIKNAQQLRETGFDVIVHKKDGSIQKWEKSKK